MIKYYSYPADKNVKLSEHFVVGEFVTYSDYHGNYPSSIPIDSGLPTTAAVVEYVNSVLRGLTNNGN